MSRKLFIQTRGPHIYVFQEINRLPAVGERSLAFTGTHWCRLSILRTVSLYPKTCQTSRHCSHSGTRVYTLYPSDLQHQYTNSPFLPPYICGGEKLLKILRQVLINLLTFDRRFGLKGFSNISILFVVHLEFVCTSTKSFLYSLYFMTCLLCFVLINPRAY